ncbi:MAG TPA: hypothetical protein VFH80_21385 [Solirubrobacteraceae bacterium]|nr:hypothetical protein [Solirubrobacteraceae bacterium]
MRGLRGPLMLVLARARRNRKRWAAPSLAIALATAFAGAVAAQSVIVGDQAARSVLAHSSPVDRTVRATWQGPLTPAVVAAARGALGGRELGPVTQVLALDPVRLSGVIVQTAAIAPADRWLSPQAARRLSVCRTRDCPMILVGSGRVPSTLTAFGARIRVVAEAPLASAVPLGFSPELDARVPVLVTGDIGGLDRLSGLSGIYHTHEWVASLRAAGLHSWTLSAVEARLAAAQAALGATQTQLELTAPFALLDQARAQASGAPTRLRLVGGGVLVSLLLFVLLAAVGLRQEQQAEIDRLRVSGARLVHTVAFVALEAAWICALALVAGFAIALAAAAILARGAGEPIGAVLSHSLLNADALLVAILGWLIATALIAVAPFVRHKRVLDGLALAAATALVAGLVLGGGSAHVWTGLLVPLCSLAAGIMLFRVSGPVLAALEHVARRGGASITGRLALVSLARAGGPAAGAIAFVAVSIALAGFALSFRATLIRGAADQAADRVPLDALIAPGQRFTHPTDLAPLSRWRALSRGGAFPVRRTDATYLGGSATVTVPMLGVPSTAVGLVHGWRANDGSEPLAVLARRLRPAGPTRSPGPLLPASARRLRVYVRSPKLDLTVIADLRDREGRIRMLSLGATAPGRDFLQAPVPPGRWELVAFELDESAALAATNGHQQAENPAPNTQFSAPITLGPITAEDAHHHVVMDKPITTWIGVGAASSGPSRGAGAAGLAFQTSGAPGVVRPVQPSDHRALPILADPGTAASAGPGRRIGLTVDGLPVQARVVGVLRRYPTVGPGTPGVIVADQQALSDALDAQLPGQGRPDEIWVSSSHLDGLRLALGQGPLAQLSAAFRSDIEHRLVSQPLASGILATLLAAGALAAALAVVGLLLVVSGPLRDRRIEADLEGQGMGPSTQRRELWLRLAFATLLGVWPGVAIAALLTRLATSTVGAAEIGTPYPPLVTVVPWPTLVILGAAVSLMCLLLGWATTAHSFPNRGGRPPSRAAPHPRPEELVEGVV